MAMIDYGVIVFKNGKQTNFHMFSDMEEAVGWSDRTLVYVNPDNGEEYKYGYLYGNHYAYVGDKDFTIGFYKNYARISWEGNNKYYYASMWDCKSHTFNFKGVTFNIKEICNRVYMCTLVYKGDHYKIVYGYGVDADVSIWNECKVRYLGKANAAKVDRILSRCSHSVWSGKD